MIRAALLRHFPTDWNREARLTGRADRPLTAEAREELARLRLPPPWDAARIVASPLMRARDTAGALARGTAVELEPALVEQDWGAWEGRLSAELMVQPASGFVPTHRLGWHDRPPGGESQADVWARLAPALARLAGEGRPVVLVLHKGVMRVLLARAGAPRDDDGGVAIRRRRLYPLRIARDGEPSEPGTPILLELRA